MRWMLLGICIGIVIKRCSYWLRDWINAAKGSLKMGIENSELRLLCGRMRTLLDNSRIICAI